MVVDVQNRSEMGIESGIDIATAPSNMSKEKRNIIKCVSLAIFEGIDLSKELTETTVWQILKVA